MEEEYWTDRYETHNRQLEDARSEYDTDYARVIHSASFRRLQGKTQILNLGDSDFYRTRLTHSLEVSQIAMGIVRQINKDYDGCDCIQHLPDPILIQAIGLTHDLGHPPFGHGGEIALNYCMRDNGGFEGNGQTLRILSKLEKFSANAGANLTRRTLLGVLKYPVAFSDAKNPQLIPQILEEPESIRIIDRKSSKPPKCYLNTEMDLVNWIFKDINKNEAEYFQSYKLKKGKHNIAEHKSFDCSIMDVADDIAYGIHDLEDSIALRLITEEQFREDIPEKICSKYLDKLSEKYPSEFGNNVYEGFVKKLFSDNKTRKRQIARLVHHFITHVEVVEIANFNEPLLKFRAQIKAENKGFLDSLQKSIVKRVIKSAGVQHLEFKGQKMVVSVFEALKSEPDCFLPNDIYELYKQEEDNRVICDYVAGMTDSFLLKTYERLFSPRMGSVFDKL